ncbi:MAG TPA: winged helix-turn-helix domain-containing protein, partial [Gemmatimonadaceae bacterium]|nr:winged helix-turn-helix domain-containing protein [Gemmatimonadaceae bacterium]
MLRLRLLGSRELERTDQGDASAVFAQPKRFALLAYMACRADRFHRRDTLLAVFWPELDAFAGRRALRNALYHLRQALGEDGFIARGDEELMIDRAKLWCDVTALG